MSRFRSSGSSIFRYLTLPQLRRKASHSWSAVQDTYFSAKDIFESHKVVLTLGTSIASVATVWVGYTLRHLHESRVEQRLEKIESGLKSKYEISDPEFKKLAAGTVSIPAFLATAGTTLCVGYFFGWRGGRWYANRKLRREKMKLLGQIKPRQWPLIALQGHLVEIKQKKWPLTLLKVHLAKLKHRRLRPLRILRRPRLTENAAKASESVAKDTATQARTASFVDTPETAAKVQPLRAAD